MSRENVEIVRRMYEAFGRGDIDAVVNQCTADVTWHVPGVAPFSGRHLGPDRVRWFFAELNRVMQMEQFDTDEFLGDADKVVVLGRQRSTVRETGRHVEFPWAHVYTMRDGKVAAAHLFGDTHAIASVLGESTQERLATTGSMGVTHEAFSGRTGE